MLPGLSAERQDRDQHSGTVRGQPGQFRRPDNKEVGSLLFPRLTGQRAAAGRFDSGPAHISANLELIIQEENGTND